LKGYTRFSQEVKNEIARKHGKPEFARNLLDRFFADGMYERKKFRPIPSGNDKNRNASVLYKNYNELKKGTNLNSLMPRFVPFSNSL